MDEQNGWVDPRLTSLLPPPTPPDPQVIRDLFFTDDAFADDTYQLMSCIHFHECETDDMIDYLWNVGDRPARDVFASFDEFREAFSTAADRDGPWRLLKTLAAQYPDREGRLVRRLPGVNANFEGAGVNHSREMRSLRKIAMLARLPRGASRHRASRRHGAGRPGHRSRQRAHAPPEGDDPADPAEPETHLAARRRQRRVLFVWGWRR